MVVILSNFQVSFSQGYFRTNISQHSVFMIVIKGLMKFTTDKVCLEDEFAVIKTANSCAFSSITRHNLSKNVGLS